MHILRSLIIFNLFFCNSKSSNTVRMFHLPSLFFSAVTNRFKYRHNAQFSVLDVYISFLCSSKSFQIPSECTFTVLVFIFFSKVPYRFKYRQNTFFGVNVFTFFFAVPNRFKYHQNAPFIVIPFFKISRGGSLSYDSFLS